MSIECYAQRLLNPFRGTMQVIRYASAEAVSTDGLHWDIYVSNDELRRGLEGQVQTSDIRYGSWSAATGLKRGPLYPSADFRRMEAMGAVVYEYLLGMHEQVPFPLRDQYEFWLLDRQARPLALLDSALAGQVLTLDRPIRWRPGMAAQARFHSPGFGSETGPSAADLVADCVNAEAGQSPAAQWFRREGPAGGTGLAGVNLPPGLVGRRLAADAFPNLLLACPGPEDRNRRLIEDFQDWQAVWLLTLPLRDAERVRLEAQARRQADLVEGVCRLYPAVIDAAAINAARVEAMLLKAQARGGGTASQDQLSTFYIELNPAGGNYT